MSDFDIDAKHARRILRRIEKKTISISLAALKSTLRFGLKVVRNAVVDRIRMDVALKKTEIRKDFMVEKLQLGGSQISRQSVKIGLRDRPIGLIRLVVGRKDVPKQKDVRPGSRQAVKIRIKPGQTKRDKGLFLARVKGGDKEFVQVFRRVKKTRSRVGKGASAPALPIQKQAIKSPHIIFENKTVQDALVANVTPIIEKRFVEEFTKRVVKGLKIKF